MLDKEKNVTPIKRGDGRYNKKFSNTYQVLDVLREYYYQMFGKDLKFDGYNKTERYYCAELPVYLYRYTCDEFDGMKTNMNSSEIVIPIMKKCLFYGQMDEEEFIQFYKYLIWPEYNSAFNFMAEKGTLNNSDNYVDFQFSRDLFECGNSNKYLEFIKKCINEITGRNINLVISHANIIKFIHVPYERTLNGHEVYERKCNSYLTYQPLIALLFELHGYNEWYINMISDDILKSLNSQDLNFLNCFQNEYNYVWEKGLEVGKKLEYVKVKNNQGSLL